MEFDYYYGKEADQFTFIRIPKLLLTHDSFAALSLQAKVLFGMLLDRMSLSMKNGWTDDENRVYIIYQIQEIQEDLGFSKKKAMDYLNELETIGLVEKKRRGLGLPSILYVKSFMSGVAQVEQAEQMKQEAQTHCSDLSVDLHMGTSRSVDLGTSGKEDGEAVVIEMPADSNENAVESAEKAAKTAPSTENRTGRGVKSGVRKQRKAEKLSRGVDLGTSRGVDLGTSRSVDSGTSRGAEIAPQEVPVRAPLMNNNKINNTYVNDIQSNHISSLPTSASQAGSSGNQDAMGCDAMDLTECRESIRDQIEYRCLVQDRSLDRDLLDGIVDIMTEVALGTGKSMLIAGATYPMELVKDRFLKLSSEHIRYVLDCFNANTTRVGNIKKYLMTALFNAPATIGGFYTAAVHHDMPYLASKKIGG